MKQVFCMYLNLLYPFAPFISLELHDVLNKGGKGNKFETLPKKLEFNYSEDFNKQIKQIKELTIGIRSLRKNLEIKPNEKIKSYYSLSTSNIRSHYVGRTFIEPTQNIRQLGVKLKHSVNKSCIENKRVVLIDDSIVRGTTANKIVKMIFEAGHQLIYL